MISFIPGWSFRFFVSQYWQIVPSLRSAADLIFSRPNWFRNFAIIAIRLFIATWLKQEYRNFIRVFYICKHITKLSTKGRISWNYSHLYASVQNTYFMVLAVCVRTITGNWWLATSCGLVTMAITFITLEKELIAHILISNGNETYRFVFLAIHCNSYITIPIHSLRQICKNYNDPLCMQNIPFQQCRICFVLLVLCLLFQHNPLSIWNWYNFIFYGIWNKTIFTKLWKISLCTPTHCSALFIFAFIFLCTSLIVFAVTFIFAFNAGSLAFFTDISL